MRSVVLTFLLLAILGTSSLQLLGFNGAFGQPADLTSVLVTKYTSTSDLQVFQIRGVRWVIVYNTFVDSSMVATAHSLGLKVMVYVTALKEAASAKNGIFNGYTTIYPQQSWAQYENLTHTYMYPDPISGELWFSPYSPYNDQVTIQRIKRNLELGADGIFLDTLILYGDPNGRYADDNPTYAHPVWVSQYPTLSYQEFRYQSLHDAAKKIYTALKIQNPNAVLIISDNNVCVQPPATETQLRAKFASAIDRWQDGADGFVLEYVGFIENNNPSDPIGEAQAIINVWSREKSTYHVSKPMWIIGFTNRDDVFNYLKSNSVTQGFGYWAYEQYLARARYAWISGTYLGAVEVENSWSSGPAGDQFTISTAFTPTAESVTLTANPGETFLLIGAAQLWNSRSDVGSSIAICSQSGSVVSGDMFAVGATSGHRHAAIAIAVVTPGSGSFTYQLRFKTDPGGTASVSGTYLLAVKFTEAPSASGPHGDQSTLSTTFTPTSESLPFTATGGEKLFLIGSAQLWNSKSNVGSSIAICRDGNRISGDIFGVGATLTHRNIATAAAVDTPSSGSHTYTLNFKTDAGGQAWASGTYLVIVKVASAVSAGPGGDQSSSSTVFTPTTQTLQISPIAGSKYLLIAPGQLWGGDPLFGQSLCITKDGSRISGDMFTVGTSITHRHLATAVAVDSPGTGTFTYAVSYKTD